MIIQTQKSNRIKSLTLTVSLLYILSSCTSDPELLPYQEKEYKDAEGNSMPYRILYPEPYDRFKKYPLVIVLHGTGERGSDNEKQLKNGARLFLQNGNQNTYPCIVIFPQCSSGGFWAKERPERHKLPKGEGFDYTQPPTADLKNAMAIVHHTIAAENIDTTRVYIIGLSMGGMGAFEAVYRYPDLFAAAVPICGGGNTEQYDDRVKATSFWIFHGAKDRVVNVEHSRVMVEKLKELDAHYKYTEYPEVKHGSWNKVFREPELLAWLFSQVKQ